MAPVIHGERGWRKLGAVRPAALAGAWWQVHWAAQIPAAFASAAIQARSDDSHANLGWDERTGALVTHPAGSARAGLRLGDLTLVMLEGARVSGQLAMAGLTLSEGLTWMSGAAAAVMEAPPRGQLVPRSWDMPEHVVGSGGRFEAPSAESLGEIARWYANADLVLGELASATPGASAVRCWPHHLDIATLVTLDEGRSAEEVPSIGIGLAPPDGSIGEPYFYANPWPNPEDRTRAPTLEGGGEWFGEGWFGAVLRGTRLADVDAVAQRARLELFLRSAVAADRRLLGEED